MYLGVDEKAFRKGHKYLTLVNDLAGSRVLYVAEDRQQSSLDGISIHRVDGWVKINMRQTEYAIRKRIQGTNVVCEGRYAFRRGLSTNLYRVGIRPEKLARKLCASATSDWSRKERELTPWPAWSKLLMSVQ